MSEAVSSLAVANAFIALGAKDGRYFTPMQLLKLTYIAHGWMLGFFDKPLTDDDVEAWKYGPVIPNLYQAIKHYGNQAVMQPIAMFGDEISELSEQQNKIILFVYQRYSHFTGIQLSNLTHQVGTPWSLFFNESTWGRRIPTATIARYYKEKTNQLLEKMAEHREQS